MYKAKPIKIQPPDICKIFVFSFFNFSVIKNPKTELIKVIIPNSIIGIKNFVLLKSREIPAENASILVATATMNKHPADKHSVFILSSFWVMASLINCIPSIANIKNTINFD